MDWQEIYKDIEDRLLPHYQCDIWERGLYYYLVSQSRLVGIDSFITPLAKLSGALRCSDWQARKIIRSLAKKGCIELEQTRKGHRVKALLPNELSLPEKTNEVVSIDIETIDFYKNRDYLEPLLKREHSQCFYCLRNIKKDSCELDHVVSLSNDGDNGYRNIVVSCHHCNTKKQGGNAEDYLRQLLRNGILSDNEFTDRLRTLDALKKGQLIPVIH